MVVKGPQNVNASFSFTILGPTSLCFSTLCICFYIKKPTTFVFVTF